MHRNYELKDSTNKKITLHLDKKIDADDDIDNDSETETADENVDF